MSIRASKQNSNRGMIWGCMCSVLLAGLLLNCWRLNASCHGCSSAAKQFTAAPAGSSDGGGSGPTTAQHMVSPTGNTSISQPDDPGTGAQQASGVATPSKGQSQPRVQFDTSKSALHPHIVESATKADDMLRAAGVAKEQRRGRIFIPLLTNRPARVCHMVGSYEEHVAPFNNTSDFFVFSVNNAAEQEYVGSCKGTKLRGTIHFLAVKEYWEPPKSSSANQQLWGGGASESYRLMGSWRLLFPFTLADILGYRYVWQLDDDSEFVLPANISLIPWMESNNLVFGFRKGYRDDITVTWGLPELTRAFLVAERLNPPGTLFTAHTYPPGIEGLYSTKDLSSTAMRAPGADAGWDRMILVGNCVMLEVSFWFQPLVQRFLELVVASGYHFRFRWNEQSVMGMIWQVFVPTDRSQPLPLPWDSYKHSGSFDPVPIDCTLRRKDTLLMECPEHLGKQPP